ncbi:MAG TPA: HAMP domain-containing sensor histidine kinase [Sphingomonas sp.]|uniref:sensor histidine kinase n=1 Tax=Sphingomonas sp. TaxID=28214 RepID=UPI002EDB4836
MRYDDMIRTVIDQPLATADARDAVWVQLIDLITQGRGGSAMAHAYAMLRDMRADTTIATRIRAARMVAGRRLSAAMIQLFADDVPSVAAPVLGTARLIGGDWAAILPQLSPTARGVLRHRRDLDAATRRALAAFGATDLVLNAPAMDVVAEPASPVVTQTAVERPVEPIVSAMGVSISDLVKRIDAYRRDRPLPGTAIAAEPVVPASEFRFEAAGDGVIFWVDGAPREAIVGETLAEVAGDEAGHGVDGHVAGAFRRRSPFRDARLSVAGAGPAAGDWRISAVPLFAPLDGRFMGYRGTARRPRPDEIATPSRRDGAVLGGIAPDSLRQLVHELRTPLNAIVGFADMIEGQILGPVAGDYRDHAGSISDDGRRLLAAVDDLDMAARLEAERVNVEVDPIEPAALLAEIASRHQPRGVHDPRLDVTIASGLVGQVGDPILFDRMLSRMIAAAIGLAEPAERVPVTLESDGAGGLVFTVARPRRLHGRDERTLLDPGYAPDGDWPDAPLLGLGFSLRLVRNLASLAGGKLYIDDMQFRLRLPRPVADSEAGSA